MNWYDVFKFLHIAAAVCWIGGGVVLMMLGILAERRKDPAAYMTVVKQVVSLAMVWFMPSALATVIFGIVAASINGLWDQAWAILGLVGFAATFVTGNFLIRPAAEKIAKLDAAGQHEQARTEARRMLQISKFDYVMLFTVIADMVFKPGWGDLVTLGVMAVVVVAGAALFLRSAFTTPAAA
jgi:uncharacterized membrane protein